MKNTPNPHMWIPYQGPEPYDEVCGLCGVFSGAHHKKPDPPAAKLPCPDPLPNDGQQQAYDSGWNLGEMTGGASLDPKLNPYPDNPHLQAAFAAGWADGQAYWLEKNGHPNDDPRGGP
jgi:hypothetical protein